MEKTRLKVEIWSDVMCPFCYIGKRRFENALEQFPQKEDVEIIWKSFQLNPSLKTEPEKNINEYLAEIKGWSVDHAKKVNEHVTEMARGVGLNYNFDKAIVANSFDAHRFSHYAKKFGKQDMAEEALFKAYFVEGRNTADHNVLAELGSEIGLNPDEIKQMLSGNEYAKEVQNDVDEAMMLGIRGVPFYVLARKLGVSGAQESATFLDALNQAFQPPS